MKKKIRVLVVDDSTFFRGRIIRALEESGEIQVVGQAANGQEAISKNRLLKPDLITMDVEMPVMDGIQAVRQIMADQPTIWPQQNVCRTTDQSQSQRCHYSTCHDF